eukprot:9099977-Alexandrium_andersonii.AAC.1
MVTADFWRAVCDRPAATALQGLPREEIAMVESAWHDMFDQERKVGMSGYIKVPERQVQKFESMSGMNGVFIRCIARHRSQDDGPPPS